MHCALLDCFSSWPIRWAIALWMLLPTAALQAQPDFQGEVHYRFKSLEHGGGEVPPIDKTARLSYALGAQGTRLRAEGNWRPTADFLLKPSGELLLLNPRRRKAFEFPALDSLRKALESPGVPDSLHIERVAGARDSLFGLSVHTLRIRYHIQNLAVTETWVTAPSLAPADFRPLFNLLPFGTPAIWAGIAQLYGVPLQRRMLVRRGQERIELRLQAVELSREAPPEKRFRLPPDWQVISNAAPEEVRPFRETPPLERWRQD